MNGMKTLQRANILMRAVKAYLQPYSFTFSTKVITSSDTQDAWNENLVHVSTSIE